MEFNMSRAQAIPAPFSASLPQVPAAGRGLKAVFSFLEALLRPGPLIAEVQAMGHLLQQAHRVEARDPAQAAMLRRQAARFCI
jgi:hypothetical protein